MEKLKVNKLKKGDTIGLLIASSCNRSTERIPKIQEEIEEEMNQQAYDEEDIQVDEVEEETSEEE